MRIIEVARGLNPKNISELFEDSEEDTSLSFIGIIDFTKYSCQEVAEVILEVVKVRRMLSEILEQFIDDLNQDPGFSYQVTYIANKARWFKSLKDLQSKLVYLKLKVNWFEENFKQIN